MNHAGERTVSRPKNDKQENPIIKFVFSSPHMTGSNQFHYQYGPQIDQIKIVNRKTRCCGSNNCNWAAARGAAAAPAGHSPIDVRNMCTRRRGGRSTSTTVLEYCQCRGTVFSAALLFSTLRSSGPERSSACPYSTRGSSSGVFSKFYRSATLSGDPPSMHSTLWWPSRMGHHVHAFPPAGAEYFCE